MPNNAMYDAGLIRARHTNASTLIGTRATPDSTQYEGRRLCERCGAEREARSESTLCRDCGGTRPHSTRETCPFCGSMDVLRNGYWTPKSGVRMQRLRCRDCGRNSQRPAGDAVPVESKAAWEQWPAPLVVDEPTACHMSREFFALEGRVEKAMNEPGTLASTARRLDLIAKTEADAVPFCAGCPYARECLERAQDGPYTGVAGGKLVVNGQVIEEA